MSRAPHEEDPEELDLPESGRAIRHDDLDDGPLGDALDEESDVGDEEAMNDDRVADDMAIGDLPFFEDDANRSIEGEGVGDVPIDDVLTFDEVALASDALGFDDAPHEGDDSLEGTSLHDGGEEGTEENIETLIDEARLPELDADDGGDYAAEDILSEFRSQGMSDDLGSHRFVRRESWKSPTPARFVCAREGWIVAADAELTWLGATEGSFSSRRLRRGATALVITRDNVLCALGSRVEVSALTSLSDEKEPLTLSTITEVNALAHFSGRSWALDSEGVLWRVEASPRVELDHVLALGQGVDCALAIASDGGNLAFVRFEGDDTGWRRSPLSPVAAAIARGERLRLRASASAETIAMCSSAGLAVSRDGGVTFERIEGGSVLAVCFHGSRADGALIALSVGKDDSLNLTVLEGDAHRVLTDLGPATARDLRGDVDLAWDDVREVAFVAWSGGLAAFGPERPH